MKVTKADFERFKKEFMRLVDVLGLKGYRYVFYQKRLNNSYATLDINENGKSVCANLTNEIPKSEGQGWISPEAQAKHEAIHLLIFRLEYLGMQRYITPVEFDEGAEAIVRVLEKVL